MTKKKKEILTLDIDVKIAILHTIAKSIYSSAARKIREAVANAIDNNARLVVIFADRENQTLTLFDNGNGINKKRFEIIFKSLGYGLFKSQQDPKLSYFGLGLMSIFRLGKKAKIFTKSINEKKTLCLNVETAKIFAPENENKSINFLEECISLSTDGDKIRHASPAPMIQYYTENILDEIPESYTEIVIEGVNKQDFNQITNPDFENELRSLLP